MIFRSKGVGFLLFFVANHSVRLCQIDCMRFVPTIFWEQLKSIGYIAKLLLLAGSPLTLNNVLLVWPVSRIITVM